MAQQKLGSAGITTREIDQTVTVSQEPVGTPAGVIGTANKGPAFVPLTLGNITDFYARFGKTDGEKFGPLAVSEWLRHATAVTYLRVLGIGDGTQRNNDGTVNSAGFVVGEQQPSGSTGVLAANPYANAGGPPGRAYVLGCFMSESAGSTYLSDAGLQIDTSAVPLVRGILFAASGVIVRLSSSFSGTNTAPSSTLVATEDSSSGGILGSMTLLSNNTARQEITVLLNGHKGTDTLYPNVLTASLDLTSPNYITNVLNTDPALLQKAGHYLYANWDVHSALATPTGSGLVVAASGSGGSATAAAGKEAIVFLTTASLARNTGSATVPNLEGFQDRFSHAKSPWIVSQKFGGERKNLFRFHALDAGSYASSLYKISIENIVTSTDPQDQYANFDVVIRQWDDRDNELKPLEQWRGLNLNPDSERYVARVIGDMHAYYNFDTSLTSQRLVIDGNYANASAYVRVEVSSDVDTQNVDETALPMGFRGPAHLVTSGSAPLTSVSSTQLNGTDLLKRTNEPPIPYRLSITAGAAPKKQVNSLLYWGTQFEHVTSVTTPNASTLKNASLKSYAKYFPDFSDTLQNVVVGDNNGVADTAANGILDSDRFCNNVFSLENIKVVTGSATTADPNEWDQAVYVRDGNITANSSTKTRAVQASDFTSANRRYLKFSLFMQGGFDGVNIFDEDEAKLTNNAVNADMDNSNRGLNNGPNVKAYQKAIDVMKSVTDVDVNMLVVPGIRNDTITDNVIQAVEDRTDAMALIDIEQYDTSDVKVTSEDQVPSVEYTVQAFIDRNLDTSYAAAYWPDVIIKDPNTNTNVVCPPSVAVLGAIALNDSIAHPWFAPAGFARGALQTTLETRVRLTKDNLDRLADANINPLTSFPGNASAGTNPTGGVVVWGQKTLQQAASSLDRVNVRRLMIELRRQVRDVVYGIIFEPNRASTLAALTAAITPRFRRIQALSGLDRFRIIFDASTTTQSDIENNVVRGKIIVQPTRSLEQISLDFEVTNNIANV